MEGNWNGALGQNKYQYNGKEWNDDFGLGWNAYGARFYDPANSRFFTGDRFAEKYLDFTPYQYGGNNPILNIDVNGGSIRVSYTGSDGSVVNLNYVKGKFQDANGNAYILGTDKFVDVVYTSLSRLELGDSGKEMVDYLAGDDGDITIKEGKKNQYNPATKEVLFNPSSATDLPTQDGFKKTPRWVSLGHEMAHAEDHKMQGTSFFMTQENWTPIGLKHGEKYATHRENQIRGENGLSLRTHYAGDMSSGTMQPYEPSRIIIKGTNSSVFYTQMTNSYTDKLGKFHSIPYQYK